MQGMIFGHAVRIRRANLIVQAALAMVLLLLVVAPAMRQSLQRNLAYLALSRGLTGHLASLDQARARFESMLEAEPSISLQFEACRAHLLSNALAEAATSCGSFGAKDLHKLTAVGKVVERVFGVEHATQVYELLRDLYPQTAIVHYQLGRIYPVGQGPATEELLKALELAENIPGTLGDAELVDAHIRLSQTFIWWQAYDLAIEHADKALLVWPIPRGYGLKAVALAHLGRHEEAEQVLAGALQVPGGYFALLTWAATSHANGDYADAIDKYNRFLDIAPQHEHGWAFEPLCRLHLEMRNAEDSVTVCAVLVKAVPGHADYHVWLGDAYLLMGDAAAAESAYGTALSLQPDNQLAQSRLASLRR